VAREEEDPRVVREDGGADVVDGCGGLDGEVLVGQRAHQELQLLAEGEWAECDGRGGGYLK